jgi:hypothetical protein
MSPRNEFRTSSAVFIGVGFIIGMVMLQTQSHWLVAAFIAWVFVGSYLMRRVKCPGCNESVTLKGQVLGLKLHAGYSSTRCKNCGCDLTLPRG